MIKSKCFMITSPNNTVAVSNVMAGIHNHFVTHLYLIYSRGKHVARTSLMDTHLTIQSNQKYFPTKSLMETSPGHAATPQFIRGNLWPVTCMLDIFEVMSYFLDQQCQFPWNSPSKQRFFHPIPSNEANLRLYKLQREIFKENANWWLLIYYNSDPHIK
jgi:hypothetical protein